MTSNCDTRIETVLDVDTASFPVSDKIDRFNPANRLYGPEHRRNERDQLDIINAIQLASRQIVQQS